MPTAISRRAVTLRDGSRVVLRPISPHDGRRLTASFARLSQTSRYRRFFTTKPELSDGELQELVGVDHVDHEAIVAIDRGTEEIVGVARYVRLPTAPETAEVAITVADDWQGRGLGRALLQQLAHGARHHGVHRFSALVQSDNRASLGLLEDVGGTRSTAGAAHTQLVMDLPPKRGIGTLLARALRAAAAGALVPARTFVDHACGAADEVPP
jgi:RimJ/RimL family protein N-acetyltransferase